jgi:uncharacterized protein YbjT (DUF2867 family)
MGVTPIHDGCDKEPCYGSSNQQPGDERAWCHGRPWALDEAGARGGLPAGRNWPSPDGAWEEEESHQDQDAIRYLSGDLATGEGIDAAVDGVGTIVHLAGSPKGDQVKAAQLVQAASRAGAAHLVFVSVVGADKIPVTSGIDRAMFGYFAAKWAAEQLIAGSGLPYTTLRATQFHSLTLLTVRQLARLPVIPVPAGWRFQPIDPGEVAERLVALALGRPAGLVPEVGGPRVYGLAELVRGYLEARGRYRPILPVWLPGGANRAFRAGANLAPERAVGRRSWEEFLADQVSQPSHSSSGPT